MKKILFTILTLTILSCEKENVEKAEPTSVIQNSECNCGLIYSMNIDTEIDTTYYQAVIYNNCSSSDTTVNYMPQTNAGNDKNVGDPHCLGVSW